jgi:glycosyltransferase involved in cell wall biosynthesis
VIVVVTARDEARCIGATLQALAGAFPRARILLADDGSLDATVAIAAGRGVEVIGTGERRGKGEAASRACRRALELGGDRSTYVLCDGDLGASAALLEPLAELVDDGTADLAIAVFEPSRRSGFGAVLAFARWALHRTTGARLVAPLSGQRALNGHTLAASVPFAGGFGMELAMTIGTLRRGGRVFELPLALEHRFTGRTPAGFCHRARQLLACFVVYMHFRSVGGGEGYARRRRMRPGRDVHHRETQ